MEVVDCLNGEIPGILFDRQAVSFHEPGKTPEQPRKDKVFG